MHHFISIEVEYLIWNHQLSHQDGYLLIILMALMTSLHCCLTGRPSYKKHDPISHSVTLSWYWANQSLSNPSSAKRQARKRQVSILLEVNLTQLRTPDLSRGKTVLHQFGHRVLWIHMFVCLLFYILATKVISGRVPTFDDSAHSWRLYSAALLGNQANSTMTW